MAVPRSRGARTPVSIRRTKELMRWIELGAFQSIFRTHEGLRPDWSHQFDTDQETLRHIARFSNVYNAWHDYRQSLVSGAAERGWPVVRHRSSTIRRTRISGRCPINRCLLVPSFGSRQCWTQVLTRLRYVCLQVTTNMLSPASDIPVRAAVRLSYQHRLALPPCSIGRITNW